MNKQLKIRGALSKDFQQVYIDDEATGIFINNEGKIKSSNISSNNIDSSVKVGDNKYLTLSDNEIDVSSGDFTLDSAGKIVLDSHTGKFLASYAGTEFSATSSAYAGMILGYTRIQNDGTSAGDSFIAVNSSSMTVLQTAQGTDLSIQFIAPPSGNVEIQCSFWVSALSDGAKFSLSTGSSYSELDETHTYDDDWNFFIDETDHNYVTMKFAVTGLTAGTDTTYYLAGLASGAGVNIVHGRYRLSNEHQAPIIIKAMALPATIVTGE